MKIIHPTVVYIKARMDGLVSKLSVSLLGWNGSIKNISFPTPPYFPGGVKLIYLDPTKLPSNFGSKHGSTHCPMFSQCAEGFFRALDFSVRPSPNWTATPDPLFVLFKSWFWLRAGVTQNKVAIYRLTLWHLEVLSEPINNVWMTFLKNQNVSRFVFYHNLNFWKYKYLFYWKLEKEIWESIILSILYYTRTMGLTSALELVG